MIVGWAKHSEEEQSAQATKEQLCTGGKILVKCCQEVCMQCINFGEPCNTAKCPDSTKYFQHKHIHGSMEAGNVCNVTLQQWNKAIAKLQISISQQSQLDVSQRGALTMTLSLVQSITHVIVYVVFWNHRSTVRTTTCNWWNLIRKEGRCNVKFKAPALRLSTVNLA